MEPRLKSNKNVLTAKKFFYLKFYNSCKTF